VLEHLDIEFLELRSLLSVATPSAVDGLDSITAMPSVELSAQPFVTSASPQGYTPAQIRSAYGFNGVTGDGTGQTIAIIEAYNDPTLSSDLAVFDAQFGLPAADLTVVNQAGGGVLPKTDSGWALETALDVEWAHAMAPGAKILVVEANSASLSDLLTAVDYARNQPGVVAVSMSWGASEFRNEASYDGYFTTPAGHTGVTFVASSGDDGGFLGPEWPATSLYVLAVGGTSLTTSSTTSSYVSETGWYGSGGGISRYEREPYYQRSVQGTGARTTPDVAYNADPNTGFAVYDSTAYQGQSGWFQIGGTSAGAPQWAAIVALADQSLARGSFDGVNQTIPYLYYLAGTSESTYFHDVTTGSSLRWLVTLGYDGVTGLGSPIVSAFVASTTGGTGVVATTAVSTSQAIVLTTSSPPGRRDEPIVVATNGPTQNPAITQAVLLTVVTTTESPQVALPPSVAPVINIAPLILPVQVSPGQSLLRLSPDDDTSVPAHTTSDPTIVDPADWSIDVQHPITLPAEEPLELDVPPPWSPEPPAYWRALESGAAVLVDEPEALRIEPQAPIVEPATYDERTSAEAALSAALAVAVWSAWERFSAKSERQRSWLSRS
jgi:hypothetical protein